MRLDSAGGGNVCYVHMYGHLVLVASLLFNDVP